MRTIIHSGLFLVSVIFFFILLYYVDNAFYIKEVRVHGADELIIPKTVTHKNLIFLHDAVIESELRKVNPTIHTIVIHKVYPSTLEIFVSLPVIVMATACDEGFLLIDSRGMVVKKTQDAKTYPKASYYQTVYCRAYENGRTVSKEHTKTAFMVGYLLERGYKTLSVDIKDIDMIVLHIKDAQIMTTAQKNIEKQARNAAVIIHSMKVSGESFSKIDVRFDKPIVVNSQI